MVPRVERISVVRDCARIVVGGWKMLSRFCGQAIAERSVYIQWIMAINELSNLEGQQAQLSKEISNLGDFRAGSIGASPLSDNGGNFEFWTIS
jgi:hypothetical protein